MGDKVIMEVYAHFTMKLIGLDDCSSVDLTKYAYVIKFYDASGQQSILHEDSKNNFWRMVSQNSILLNTMEIYWKCH
jgi:hypothetical protein